MNDTFSLLVPCYNAEKYIPTFIENIEKQERKFDEIIFYDDASTDNTADILIKSGYNVIRGMENKGPSFARNKLAEKTFCEWFHFHDIDDLLDPHYLEKTSALVGDQIDVILCNVNWYDSTKQNIVLKWEYSDKKIKETPLNYTISNPIGGINGLYRKKAFQAIKGFNTEIKLWEDADLHVRLAANNTKLCVLEEPLSFAIRHSQSLSSNQRAAWLTRGQLLRNYFNSYCSLSTQKCIGFEAQKAASQLMIYNEIKAAKDALKLSEQCGLKVPLSKNIIWKTLKTILPRQLRIHLRIIQLKIVFNNTPQNAK